MVAEPTQTQDPINAVLVGVPEIDDFLRQLKPEWHFYPHIASAKELRDNFTNETTVSIPDVLFIIDELFFDPTGDDTDMPFVIAAYAPIMFVVVISYKPEWQQQIIAQVAEQVTLNDFVYAPFYFMDPNDPQATLERAISQFSEDVRKNPEGMTSPLAQIG